MVTYKDEIKDINYKLDNNNEDDIKLLQDAQNGNENAIDKVITMHLPLVIGFISKNYKNRNMDMDDLIGYGNLGLMKAINKYKFDKNTKFSSYAVMWIKQTINRALEKNNTVNYAGQISNLKIKYTYFRDNYFKLNQEYPTIEQISKHLNITIEKTKLIEQTINGTYSLDFEIGDSKNQIQVESTIQNPENSLINAFDNELLFMCLDKLDPDEKSIIELRYGIYDGKEHKIRDISKRLGIRYSDINRIEQEALEKLKELLLDKGM